MERFVGKKIGCLIKDVEEKALSKKADVDQQDQKDAVPHLDKDCISSILIRLPLESIPRSRFVCKPWYDIITSQPFIDAQFRSSETVLIFLKPIPNEILNNYSLSSRQKEKSNVFSVESHLTQPKPTEGFSIFLKPAVSCFQESYYIQFIGFNDGKGTLGEYSVTCQGNIRATCNGLILLDNKLKGGLIVMNPVTRKLNVLPACTIMPPHNESYGFTFNEVTGEYKIVHLFRDELNYVSCETMILGRRSWREVNGPPFGVFGWFGYYPVSAIGALHWIPQVDDSNHIVSMDVETDKFIITQLPKSSRMHDRIIEMGGFLCFITHEELNIDIWRLKSLNDGKWTKQHSITRGVILDLVPLISLRIASDIIFMRDEDHSFYTYDLRNQKIRKIEMETNCFILPGSYAPHVNSLLYWARQDILT